MLRFIAALALLCSAAILLHGTTASAQAVKVFVGNDCLLIERQTGRTPPAYINNCGAPVRLFVCHSADQSGDSCTASQYTEYRLNGGRLTVLRAPGGTYPHHRTCSDGEQLVNWKGIRSASSQVQCRYPPIAAMTDPGYRGTGVAPNLSAPAAILRATELLSDSDYPEDLKQMLIEGVTTVSIAVAPNGRATGCRIEQTSGYRALDEATCTAFMLRGRFTPAKDAGGNPVDSVFANKKLVWAIP